MTLTRRTMLVGGLAAATPASSAATERLITGVNLAGLEFRSRALPGRLDHDYVTPTTAELDYYRSCGATAVRIPFLWERLQPDLGGAFADAYWNLLQRLISATSERGMRIILDPHQYGRRRMDGATHIIGEGGGVTGAHFAGFWAELARRCRSADHVVFGLQNEPHDQDQRALARVHNAAIAAIRAAGARNLVLVPGGAWSGAHSWLTSGNAESTLQIAASAAPMAFDVHQYLDATSSGGSRDCAADAGARLEPFTAWARRNGKRGFLGEFGAGAGAGCATELAALLDHMARNRDVWIGWTYWAGGPWWDEDYPLSIEPASLRQPQDRPQMAVLRRYFE